MTGGTARSQRIVRGPKDTRGGSGSIEAKGAAVNRHHLCGNNFLLLWDPEYPTRFLSYSCNNTKHA